MDDVIAAIATPISPASVGIIRLSGNGCIELVDDLFRSKKTNKKLVNVKSHTLNYGHIVDKNEGIIDEVLVSVMKCPNSFTMEDIVEINSHGGVIVMEKILSLVLNHGARLAEPGEFTKRAFLNGRLDLTQAEAVIDIIESKTELALKSSMNQLNGAITKRVNEIKALILEIIAHVEASIDYPEYDIEELSYDNINAKIEKIRFEIERLISSYSNGKIIKEGIKTVIVGKPNVGKSSLLNALLKDNRAIVTNIPGTTRDVIEEYLNIHDIPVRLMDTAGIRETDDTVEKIGVMKSKEKINQADLIIFMIDGSRKLDDEDIEILELISDKKAIVLINKIDMDAVVDEKIIKKYISDKKVIPISAKNLLGIEALENEIKEMFLVGKIDLNDNVYITNVRHKVALDKAMASIEMINQALLDEMPIDLVVIDIKNLLDFVGELTGDSMKEDIVGEIFSRFCLGK